MKLYMLDHDNYGVWYFTNLHLASQATGVSHVILELRSHDGKKTKGWSVELIEDDYIMSGFINPSREKVMKNYYE